MSSIPQMTDNGNSVSDFASKFMQRFHLGSLLFKCNAGKAKGIPVMDVFRYLFCMMFSDRSVYMQMKTGTFAGEFSKNTIYRFLNNARINWQRFTTLLSAGIINDFMKPLTSEDRKDVFIVDDSLFDRSRSKKVELLARVFDHCSMKYRSGFRMLTLGWSDGNSFVPVSHCLLSAAKDKNLLCEGKPCDGRSLAGKRRLQSRRKATDVMVELVHCAQCAGITAKYILFDSWFSAPKTILELKKKEHLDTIAMVKKSKTKYLYKGEKLNVKEIYARNKKRRGRSRYLLSVSVEIEKNGERIPAKFVYVRNKSNRKDWLVIVSTDTELSEEEIIRIYGKRWDIIPISELYPLFRYFFNSVFMNGEGQLPGNTALFPIIIGINHFGSQSHIRVFSASAYLNESSSLNMAMLLFWDCLLILSVSCLYIVWCSHWHAVSCTNAKCQGLPARYRGIVRVPLSRREPSSCSIFNSENLRNLSKRKKICFKNLELIFIIGMQLTVPVYL